LFGVVSVAVLCGCGATSHRVASGSTSGTSSARSTTSGSTPPVSSVIGARTVAAGEFAGFTPSQPVVVTTPQAWVAFDEYRSSQRSATLARLRRLGFVAAAREDLTWAKPSASGGTATGGLSTVEQFASSVGARSDLAAELPGLGPGKPFAVPGVPGAHGVAGSGGGEVGDNVLFAVGSYVYLVGAGWPAGSDPAPTRASLIGSVQHLYRRAGH
jgi:hypothetical protein